VRGVGMLYSAIPRGGAPTWGKENVVESVELRGKGGWEGDTRMAVETLPIEGGS